MIEGKKYIEIVKSYFGFLVIEFGFNLQQETTRGNTFYDVKYKSETRVVSISYENIEDYLQVIIFILQKRELPDYDDKTKTLHLNKLNLEVRSKVDKHEIDLNNKYFLEFNPEDELERKLLKSAKELRLYLIHF